MLPLKNLACKGLSIYQHNVIHILQKALHRYWSAGASEVTLRNINEYIVWICGELWYHQNQIKHNKLCAYFILQLTGKNTV